MSARDAAYEQLQAHPLTEQEQAAQRLVPKQTWGGQDQVDIGADGWSHGAQAFFLLIPGLFALARLVARSWLSRRMDLLVSDPVGFQRVFPEQLPELTDRHVLVV